MSQIVESCPAAKVCISAALRNQEFLTLAASTERSMIKWPGAAEMKGVLEALAERVQEDNRIPLFAIEGRLLVDRSRVDGSRVTLRCLSPCDFRINDSLQYFGHLLKEGSPVRAIVDQDANMFCVALWLEAGSLKILFGSDLTPRMSEGSGWLAVVSHARDTGLNSARVIKVPHHGAPR
jgi:hypothetical protein